MGGVLHTNGDANRLHDGLPKQRERSAAWHQACRLLVQRADAAAVTRQLSLALLMDAKLDVHRSA
jgi:hypothetical protein